ncbi:MAG: TolB protein [Pyrinomonadaceae bacterium]|nr:TolB protein [Pyrinomonadaceae bacterium]
MSTSFRVKRLTGLTLILAILLNCFASSIYPVTITFSSAMNHASSRDKGAAAVPFAQPTHNRWNNNYASLLSSFDPTPTPTPTPTNDNFTDAAEIDGDTGSATVDNTYATVETGELDHADCAAGFSVWYRWQPTTSGNVTFDTIGSMSNLGNQADTVLGVYTGGSLGTLTEVASNDDVPSDVYSVVSFNATANTVYYIALDVYDELAYPGALVLNWQPGLPSPTPTPDANNKIVFGSYHGVTMQVFTINDDGGAQTRLTDKTFDCHKPVWSPDGTKIAFISFRDGQSEIYVMDADGSNQTRVTESSGSFTPSWSPDGAKLAFTSYDSEYNSEVFVSDVDGTDLTNLSQDTTGNSFLPSWSPDGTKVMFVSSREGDPNIYVIDGDGTNLTRLTTASDDAPVWSPDGTMIAFVRWGLAGSEIYVMDADGSNQTNVSNTGSVLPYPPYNFEPNWSPDGTKIAFSRYSDDLWTIHVADADGSNPAQLTTTYSSYEPRWSPDGTHIGFLTCRTVDQDIYLMDADGSNQINLTSTSSYNGSFSWQPLAAPAP